MQINLVELCAAFHAEFCAVRKLCAAVGAESRTVLKLCTAIFAEHECVLLDVCYRRRQIVSTPPG